MKTYGAASPAPPHRHRRPSRFAAAVAATLAIGMLVAVKPAPAEAATVDTNAWYVLVNRNSGKALDVDGASTGDGARVNQWTRNDGANQQWQFVDSGGGFYRLKARHSGKVLDVAGASTADGAAIQQWTDHNGANQRFRLADSDADHVRLISGSGKAVEVQGASTADGGNVVQYADWGGANQQWRMVKLSSGGDGGCGSAPTLASGTHTIQSSGKSRSFILRVPSNYDNSHPYRLIFAFHWRGGTAGDVASGGTSGSAWSYYGQQEQSNDSAILVAPQGLGNGWANSGGEDVTFVDDMIRRIESGLCVNTTQRFATGFSWGGGMSYALACARANAFRAVAVIAGGQISGCSGGTQPIAYFGIHGISDSVLTIAQGRSLRDKFVANNGCTSQSPREPAPGSRMHITTTYSGCRAGYPVQWAAFDGGHIPGPVDGSSNESGIATWTKGEIWRFFAQFQ
ncbi:RICIN domain-containing protein [Actinomadura viridis]|uniref:Poly(3-hydroxybutyrate) depolymerase n=1 Tax=Actinomadura viridis TaxID=58110 RepID=A0A931DQS9_9ACTN|nr:RICIN domain-containing protein [Actinomadura viridis]MBG6092096.1 poly(3-hydroxybutyrate) depolymerase [Actinomadura viridis]